MVLVINYTLLMLNFLNMLVKLRLEHQQRDISKTCLSIRIKHLLNGQFRDVCKSSCSKSGNFFKIKKLLVEKVSMYFENGELKLSVQENFLSFCNTFKILIAIQSKLNARPI